MDTGRYTLQELAVAAGMTVRNVRSYQTRGLLQGPERRRRRAEYTEEHLARLQAIQRARSKGASLTLIARHLAGGGTLSVETLDHTWLPSPRPAPAPGPVRQGDDWLSGLDAALDDLLSTQGAAARRLVDRLVDSLAAAQLLRCTDSAVYASGPLRAALTALGNQGLPVEQSLQVAVAAARAGESLAGRITAAAAATGQPEQTTAALNALAGGVLGGVLAAGRRG